MSDCIFCRIVRQEIPAQVVCEDQYAVAFRDINPQAPTHILVIPKKHVQSLDQCSPPDQALLGHLLLMVQRIARDENVASAYRVVLNNGTDAGQSVFHVHLHLLGGRPFSWPPG